jgi:acetyl-CoA carboxylase biotin carboxyl carrier protein
VDEKHLLELLDYLSSSSFVEFEMERGGFKLRLVRQAAPAAVAPAPAPQPVAHAPAPAAGAPAGAAPATDAAVEDGLEDITSPMVGTFYRAPNPTADPFVNVGDTVEPGQVIGIVEAMKLMNEIEADRRGEIVEIAVTNGQPVEYGETIFKIRPVA